VAGDIGPKLEIVYHIHLIENTGFLEDLFCKTKPFSAFQDGRIRGVAYILAEILCSYRSLQFWQIQIPIGYQKLAL